MSDSLLDDLTRRVANRLRHFMRVLLIGNVSAQLTNRELNDWIEFCKTNPEFQSLFEIGDEHKLAMARISGGDLSAEAEQRYRAAKAAFDAAVDAMTLVSSAWYAQICEATPDCGRPE